MKIGLKLGLLFVSICLLFCSCDFATGELKNRLIIQAIGVDALENGRVRVTLQTLNTEMAGNPNSGSNRGDIIQSMTMEGDTIAAAVSEAAKSVGKMPLLVQNRVVVFGKETATAGLRPYLDYFVREVENRATVQLAISETTAEELVSAKMGESVLAANSMEDILQAGQFNSKIVGQPLFRFVHLLQTDTANAYLPILSVENGGEEQRMYLSGVGVFQADRLYYTLSDSQVTALTLLSNTAKEALFSVDNEKYHANTVLRIRKYHLKIQPRVVENTVQFTVRLDTHIDIFENRTDSPFQVDEAFLSETKRLAETALQDLCMQSLTENFRMYGSDPYNFGNRLKRKEPKFFKTQVADWHQVLPQVQFSVHVEVKISRVGNAV